MRIIFIGDIMGRSGREALEKHLPHLREELKPDIIIVNGENATNGRGINIKACKQFYDWESIASPPATISGTSAK